MCLGVFLKTFCIQDHFVIKHNFVLAFPVWSLFIYFLAILPLLESPGQCLNVSWEKCCSFNVGRKVIDSPFNVVINISCSVVVVIVVFLMSRCWVLWNVYSVSRWLWEFLVIILSVWHYNSTWSWCIIIFICFWLQLANVFLRFPLYI